MGATCLCAEGAGLAADMRQTDSPAALCPLPDCPAPQPLMRATTHREEGEVGEVLPWWRRKGKRIIKKGCEGKRELAALFFWPTRAAARVVNCAAALAPDAHRGTPRGRTRCAPRKSTSPT